MRVRIPHKFSPRAYQVPVFEAFDSGIKRGVVVWHRRAGKDRSALNLMIKKMFERVGGYYYFFPTKVQGKKILWDGISGDGFPYMNHFPPELVTNKSDGEMKVRVRNGSVFQIQGANDPDTEVGTNAVGMVFSEWPLMNPQIWNLTRPIVRENGGWALFIYTPRQHNHGYTLYQMARKNPEWFTSLLTVDQTQREDGSPVVSAADIEKERQEGMSEELIQEEYYCSFDANVEGAYYAKLITKAEQQGRITRVPVDPRLPVLTSWDLGIDDATAIWFMQASRTECRAVDYLEDSGEGLAYYAKALQDRGYLYGGHIFPHDVEVRELGTGKSRKETAQGLGIKPLTVAPDLSVEDGIEAVRGIIPVTWFDAEKCEQGLEALKNYRKEYDEKTKTFKNHPLHDWSEHGSSSFRYFAVGHKVKPEAKPPAPAVPGGPGGWMG